MTGAQQPRSVELLGRLKEGVSIEQAKASLTPVLVGTITGQDDIRAAVRPEPTPIALELDLLLIAAPIFALFGLVLATACANVSNVMLARSIARHREIAVRLSIGVSRGRVIRQLLTEGLLIALLAGLVGLALAAWALRAGTVILLSTLPPSFGEIIRLAPIGIDARVFAFALSVAAVATLMFALLPATQASRLSLTGALRGHSAGTLRNSRLRNALIVGQVAVSLVLVVAALTFTRNSSTHTGGGSCCGRVRSRQEHHTAASSYETASLGPYYLHVSTAGENPKGAVHEELAYFSYDRFLRVGDRWAVKGCQAPVTTTE